MSYTSWPAWTFFFLLFPVLFKSLVSSSWLSHCLRDDFFSPPREQQGMWTTQLFFGKLSKLNWKSN